MYTADGFTIIKYEGYYKVFLCWRYCSGMWRLSSGADLDKLNLETLEWEQCSGSIYSLKGDEGGMEFYQRNILEHILNMHGGEEVKLSSIS